jgi:hypothetical protein
MGLKSQICSLLTRCLRLLIGHPGLGLSSQLLNPLAVRFPIGYRSNDASSFNFEITVEELVNGERLLSNAKPLEGYFTFRRLTLGLPIHHAVDVALP